MKSRKIVQTILALVCCAVMVWGMLGLDRVSPSYATEGKKPASAMLVPEGNLVYDEESSLDVDNANIHSGTSQSEEDTQTTPPDGEEESNESHQGEEKPDEESDVEHPSDLPSDLPPVKDEGNQPQELPDHHVSDQEQLPDEDAGDPNGSEEKPENGSTGDGEQLPEEGPSENPGDEETGKFENYFTTSILDNDVLGSPDYTFTITHLKPELKVTGISVTVNGKEQTYRGIENSFRITLSEGSNAILVQVLYQDGGDYITASRGYTLYYARGEQVVIVSSLENIHRVTGESLTFTAYGRKGNEKLSASVRVNGTTISGSNNTFTVHLKFGENIITVSAGGRKDSVTKKYTVVYAEDVFKITTSISDTVITNDTNQPEYIREEVVVHGDTEFYKFRVDLNAVTGKEKIIRIKHDDKVVQPGGDGWYTVELSQRDPTVVTIYYCNSNGEKMSYRFLLRFKRNGEVTPAGKYPTIYAKVEMGDTVVNLENGLTFKNPDVVINITARSWNNEQLYANHFKVSVNGKPLPQHDYQTGYVFGYNTYLTQEGENTITVTVTDNDGYAVTKNWRVYYKPGNIKVTVSVEATTVGLGYLIPPTQVEVPAGTNAMDIVTSLLKQNGFSYENNGGTYLSQISRPGLCNGFHIDPELMQLIVNDGMDELGAGFSPTPASMDSLGEFDFYRWSGWMYSYNGNYPGYGLNVCKPQDGAVIRVRFTLALGKDIGGYVAPPGNGYGVIPGNYNKEW